MIKWYHLILTLALGIGIGILIVSYWPSNESDLEDPQIHRLNAEIGWRQFKENKIKDSLKVERKEKLILAKENIELRAIANQAINHFAEVRKMVPLTHKDTIVFLMRDTTVCDSALQRSQDLVQGLTKEIINDNREIQTLDSLNISLDLDKRDLLKVDSVHQKKEKQLERKIRRRGLRCLGVGGVIGAILILLF